MQETDRLQVACPQCGKRLHVKAAQEGKRVKCPACSNLFPVPGGEQATKQQGTQQSEQDRRLSPRCRAAGNVRQGDSAEVRTPREHDETSPGAPAGPEAQRQEGKVWGVAGIAVALLALLGIGVLWLALQRSSRQAEDRLTAAEQQIEEQRLQQQTALTTLQVQDGALKKQVTELTTRLTKLSEQAEALSTGFSTTVKDGQKSIQEVHKLLVGIEKQLGSLGAENRGLNSALVAARKELEALNKKYKDALTSSNDLRKQLRAAKGAAPAEADSKTSGPDKKEGLNALLKGVKDQKEAKRGRLIAFPRALVILAAAPKSEFAKTLGSMGMETYSTHLNEEKLLKQFGQPDETGTEDLRVTDNRGFPTTVSSKMLRYDWLRIYVSTKGEIWYVRRQLK